MRNVVELVRVSTQSQTFAVVALIAPLAVIIAAAVLSADARR